MKLKAGWRASMPIRDYKCRVCGAKWEELRKDQTDPHRCVVCKCDTVDRVVTAGAFSFKHGGLKDGYKSRSK